MRQYAQVQKPQGQPVCADCCLLQLARKRSRLRALVDSKTAVVRIGALTTLLGFNASMLGFNAHHLTKKLPVP